MTIKSNANSEFCAHLRTEMLKQQDRRAEHVKSKFTFVVALGGLTATLQSVKFQDPIAINFLIYAIPLVAALFDFYILGGEFAVKRIRSFLIIEDKDHTAEKQWAAFLGTWPKDFMRKNRLITTGFINIASVGVAAGNLLVFCANTFQWFIFIFWVISISCIYIHLVGIERTIRAGFTKAVESTTNIVEHRGK